MFTGSTEVQCLLEITTHRPVDIEMILCFVLLHMYFLEAHTPRLFIYMFISFFINIVSDLDCCTSKICTTIGQNSSKIFKIFLMSCTNPS